MRCKRKFRKFANKTCIGKLMKTKPIRNITIYRNFVVGQDKSYLSRLMNVVKGISFGIEHRFECVSKAILDTLTEYSKNVTDYLYTKFKVISPSLKCMENICPNIRKVMTGTTNVYNSFTTKEISDGSARSIAVQLWNTKRLRDFEVFSVRISVIRKIIRSTLKAMTELEMQLFLRLMVPTNVYFPHINKYFYNRNKYISCINNRIRDDVLALDIVIQNLQSWYLIQPVVLKLYKIVGKYSSDIGNIMSDLEALYENYLVIKYENNRSK